MIEKLTPSERRAEIVRVLSARRKVTIREFAEMFGVTQRTVMNDLEIIPPDSCAFEIERGRYGGVKACEWWYDGKFRLCREDEAMLARFLNKASDPRDTERLSKFLAAYGSPANHNSYIGKEMKN
ncbi:MAG: HTH domain-containing protein [Oscillospiraceae bacterium]|nr:HTH domain-containing protein [Oscillospiraceae bacterium]